MDGSIIQLLVATVCFVATHLLMSGPVRPALLAKMGEQGFLLFYSLVSIATFAWAVVAFDRAPPEEALWNGLSPLPWLLASVLTIIALALFLPSFVRNPALPGKTAAGLGTVIPTGIYRVTRHPMMWGIALWALGHMVASPTPRVLIFMSGLIVLALVGSYLQDKRKVAQNKREFAPWQRRTSLRPRIGALASLPSIWLLAFLVWFIVTWLHYHLFGIPAGLWLWVG